VINAPHASITRRELLWSQFVSNVSIVEDSAEREWPPPIAIVSMDRDGFA
jgi:hypothetical protein